jgi:hypothetical protein
MFSRAVVISRAMIYDLIIVIIKLTLPEMIDPERQLFPFCIVWTVIPCISWLFPVIGHTGICEYFNYYSAHRE